MSIQNGIDQVFDKHQLIPVVKIEKVEEVEGILNHLKSQNIHCIEITLRTNKAYACIQRALELTDESFQVGVGTVVHAEQVQQCKELGVAFMVSPGFSPALIHEMEQSGIAYIPGVMTPSEIVQAMNLSCTYLKFFPFNIAGGLKALKSYSNVFPELKFCPTGGIGAANYEEILRLDAVVAVGGSWLVKS